MTKKLISSLIVLALSLSTMLSVKAVESFFPDVAESHPHFQGISEVHDLGIVSGYPDGTYKPDKEINRAEFSKIILEAAFDNIPEAKDKNCLSDITPEQWFQKYVCFAKEKNIIQGYQDGTFMPHISTQNHLTIKSQ